MLILHSWGGSDVSRLQTVPYNCTFGAPNKGQTLDVCQVHTAESDFRILQGDKLATSLLGEMQTL
jgi:hypothetical protein